MDEITILLAPAPKAPNPDFLATAKYHQDPPPSQAEDLPFEITLDSYTRDPWSHTKPQSSHLDQTVEWHGRWLKAIDDKRRLPGFLKFLKGRKKAAYGKYDSPHPDESTGETPTALFLVPFEQPPLPSSAGDLSSEERDRFMYIKYCLDSKSLFAKPKITVQQQQQQHHQMRRAQQPKGKKLTQPPQQQPLSLGSGLLGKLVGAQHQTNRHLDSVPSQKEKNETDATASCDLDNGSGSITSGMAIAKFRTKVEEILLKFQRNATQSEIKVPISLAEQARNVQSTDKANINMDVLKYIVYEQVEEIGQDVWIATKEASEFMDEANIAIYKSADVAPPEVLEDFNKGDLPDEVRQQQRFMRESMAKEEKKRAKLKDEENLRKATTGDTDGIATLNMKKRDRRTIEEIQRGMITEHKRGRME
jgi:hypothetical protein